MEEISHLRRDLVRQSSQGSELQSATATAVTNLPGQLSRTEQRLDAKIDTLGTQLAEIISFLTHADDKKRGRRG